MCQTFSHQVCFKGVVFVLLFFSLFFGGAAGVKVYTLGSFRFATTRGPRK